MKDIKNFYIIFGLLSSDGSVEIDNFWYLILKIEGQISDIVFCVEPSWNTQFFNQRVEIFGGCKERVDPAFEISEDVNINEI